MITSPLQPPLPLTPKTAQSLQRLCAVLLSGTTVDGMAQP